MKPILPNLFLLSFCAITLNSYAQTQEWSTFVPDIPSLSSPRLADLNNDGLKDIVIGGGTDSTYSLHGIMAIDGANGNLLWELPTKNEVFASAQFLDITADGIPDVFISGREAQLYAINGATGAIIWEYYPLTTDPALDGLYNFYSPQFIPDASGDLVADILVTNGGDHNAPVWVTNRPPGYLMVINSVTGALISQAVVPDSAEIYCSPVVADIKNDGNLWVLYGTGGETLGGSMWAVELEDVLNADISNSVVLVTDPNLGFVAPASVADFNGSGELDIIIQAYNGSVYKVKGSDFTVEWSVHNPGTESSAAPVIGNFTGNITPDIFCVLAKGSAPSYTDFYQVMIDGNTGLMIKKDSIGMLHFASANAFDANGDGRDEVLVTLNNHVGHFEHQLMLFDYQNNTFTNYWNAEAGVNIGCTPWVGDMDNNGNLEIVYIVKSDSINPMGWKGIHIRRLNTGISIPNAGIAWGSYMGTQYNGHYNYTPVNCGSGSLLTGGNTVNPSCNGHSDGSLSVIAGNGTAPYTYLWSDGSVGNSLSNLNAGMYYVLVTDANGCFEKVATSLNDPFNITFGGVTHVLCPGGSNGQATVGSSGCVCMFSGCTFLWDNGGTTYTGTGLTAGDHNVEITHVNGCVVNATITINDGLPLVDSVLQTNVTCHNYNDGDIEVYPSNASTTTFNWSTTATSSMINSLSAGNYSVTVQDTRPCAANLNFTLVEPDALVATNTVSNLNCFGDTDGAIEVSAIGGNGGNSFYANTTSNSDGFFTALNGGNYSVYVLDSLGCSSDTANVQIIEPTAISTTMSATHESVVGNGTASTTISGGTTPYSVLWNDASSQTTTTAQNLAAGTYTITVTDNNGCTHTDDVEVLSTLFVDEIGQNIAVIVYPNPASDFLIVEFTSFKPTMQVELFDLMGRKVTETLLITSNKLIVERNGLASGNYILRITDESQSMQMSVSFK